MNIATSGYQAKSPIGTMQRSPSATQHATNTQDMKENQLSGRKGGLNITNDEIGGMQNDDDASF